MIVSERYILFEPKLMQKLTAFPSFLLKLKSWNIHCTLIRFLGSSLGSVLFLEIPWPPPHPPALVPPPPSVDSTPEVCGALELPREASSGNLRMSKTNNRTKCCSNSFSTIAVNSPAYHSDCGIILRFPCLRPVSYLILNWLFLSYNLTVHQLSHTVYKRWFTSWSVCYTRLTSVSLWHLGFHSHSLRLKSSDCYLLICILTFLLC